MIKMNTWNKKIDTTDFRKCPRNRIRITSPPISINSFVTPRYSVARVTKILWILNDNFRRIPNDVDQVRSDRDLDQTVVGPRWTDEPTKLFNQGEGMA